MRFINQLKQNTPKHLFFLSISLILCIPNVIFAYIGPGAGISAIGSFLALLAGIVIAIIGFLWYPIKRLFFKKKSKEPEHIEE